MRYTFDYVGVQVTDLDRSVSFYCSLLGMRLRRREKVPETGGEWAELVSPGSPQVLELNWYGEASPHATDRYRLGNELDHLAFDCDDADAAFQELVDQGVTPALPPFTEGDCRLAFVQDPDGIWIELSSRRPPNPQP